MLETQRRAVGFLLMIDETEHRALTYEQFDKLSMTMPTASSVTFHTMCTQLKERAESTTLISKNF